MQLLRGSEADLDGPSLGRGATVLDERAAGVVLAVLQAYAARVGLPRCCTCTTVKADADTHPTPTPTPNPTPMQGQAQLRRCTEAWYEDGPGKR